jgi:purine-binding chemotaxis protein CheW
MRMKTLSKAQAVGTAFDLMPKDAAALKILEVRAESIAKAAIDSTLKSTLSTYIKFSFGGKAFFGIPYGSSREVINDAVLTKIPNTPNYVAGIINRRSALIMVIDLRDFFHIPKVEKTSQREYVLVVSAKDLTIGILADNIEGSDAYEPTSLDALLVTEAIAKPQYILGLHKGVTAILNIEALIVDVCANLEKL